MIYKAIDLFAGIGGIRLGFENAFNDDIKTIFVSDFDKNANKTYKLNFSDNFDIAGDITKIKETDIPAFDICLAGFPCQAFSIAGKHKGFSDNYYGVQRGNLFLDVIRICNYHKPLVIFCENVKGLFNHNKGNTFNIIKYYLESINYDVFYKIINSRDFGVPQNRERLYIVCFRKDLGVEHFKFPEGTPIKTTIRDILDNAPIPSKYYLSDKYLKTLIKHKERHKSNGHGFGYVIRNLDGIAGTVVCGGSGLEGNLIKDEREHSLIPTRKISSEINKESIRKMTPREWARLQGFPEDFRLEIADTHLYKQLGNTVTINVVEAIAYKIKNKLFEIEKSS